MGDSILIDHKMERIIRLILEGNETNSVLLRSGIYCVALEALREVLVGKENKKTKLIKDKKSFGKIRKKLTKALKEVEGINSEHLRILSGRITNLNQGTNSSKLEEPFELYSIDLTDNDIQTIGYRNDFLHGSSPIVGFEESEDKRIKLLLIAHKMNFLVCSLLLKHLGYSGHVCNYFAKLEEKAKGESSEKFIREI